MTREERRREKKRRQIIKAAAETAGLLVLLIVCLVLLRRPDGSWVFSAPTAAPAATPFSMPEPTAAPDFTPEPTPVPTSEPTPEPTAVTITLTAVGDCTLGGNMNGPTEGRFFEYVSNKDGSVNYDYCFNNVRDIFEADDVTLVNLEVVLTDSSDYLKRDDKVYIMRGRPDYVNMLTGSSVEVCNIANNHITDFGDWGIEQTAALLDENGLQYCGYGYTCLREVKGVVLGFVGVNYWTTKEAEFEKIVSDMRAQCDILIVSMHWGNELEYYPRDYQLKWGRKAVDLGANLVIGHHSHVVEGIETYKGVNIVYSLGNFCFGGKANPDDKDTFIWQTEFTVQPDGRLETAYNVIPCRITSNDSTNNYQPTPITDSKKRQALLEKLEYYSRKLIAPPELTD